MVEHAPRDFDQWMKSVERRLMSASRAAANIPFTYNEKLKGDILADKLRHPTAPVEITWQTAFYAPDGLATQYARLMVDFPDVTKATDGTDIPIKEYELWIRDDTTNYLEATTDAAAGLAAPGLTIPGLASTPAMTAKAAAALGPFKRAAVSSDSSLRVDGLIPGTIYTFRVRAIGRFTTAPGEWSSDFQAQMDADTTPPPQPTVPLLTVSRGTITAKWDGLSVNGSMPGDFSHLVVAYGTSSSPINEEVRFFRGGGTTVISDVDYYTPVFVRFRAVDYSGNSSPWSEQAVAYTQPLVDTDIILSEIDADKTLIRNIGAEAIKDAAIRAEKLADGAVSLDKLESSVQDALGQGASAMAQFGTLAGQVVSLQGSVDGKTTITSSTADASASVGGAVEGDRWQKWSALDATGKLLASWRWTNGAWVPEAMDPAYLPLIDIGQGTFGSLSGGRLATNSVDARSIIVGDFANLAVGSDFEVASAVPWTLAPEHVISTTQKRFGTSSLRLGPVANPATPASSVFVGDLRVKEAEQWYFKLWVYLDASFNGDTNSKLRISNQAGTPLPAIITYNAVPAGVWTALDATLTIPAGTTSLQVQLWNTNTAGYAYIDDIQIRRVAEPSLIQNLGVEKLTATNAAMNQAVIDKLWADVVNSRKITTNMLLVGNGPNMVPNGALEMGSNAGWRSELTYDTADKPAGFAASLRSPAASGTLTNAGTEFWAVQPNEQYLTEFWIKADKPNSRIYIELRDQANAHGTTNVATADSPPVNGGAYLLNSTVVPTVWTKYSMITTTSATANKLRVGAIYFNHPNGTELTATVWLAGLTMRPLADGNIIATGSVTTTHLGAESVTAAKIKALDITAGQLAANAVEADKIKAGAVQAAKLEATLALVTNVVAGDPAGVHAAMEPTGFKVYGKNPDDNTPYEVVSMGVANQDDLFAITDSTGVKVAQINDAGVISGQTVDAKSEIYYKGTELQTILDALPRGIVAWRQFPRPASYAYPTLPSAGGEVGLFEIGWRTEDDIPARLYKVNVPKMLLKSLSGSATTIGLTMRFTDDGSAPTVNSQLITSDWGYASPGGYRSAGFNNQLVGSANGPYIRVLISMWATGGCSIDNAGLPMISVEDAGLSVPQGGSYTTGGGTVGTGTTSTAPANPVVTKAVEYSPISGGIRSFLPAGGQYAYNVGKGYQGLSPAGYGNLKSMYVFPSVTGILTGATVNDIWIYLYFEHWYNNAGGYAKIGLHPNSAMPATWNTNTTLQVTSPLWPKASGRYVRLPDSTYAGFVSGAWRGFTLLGDSTYNSYGIANSAKLKIRYTK